MKLLELEGHDEGLDNGEEEYLGIMERGGWDTLLERETEVLGVRSNSRYGNLNSLKRTSLEMYSLTLEARHL